MDWILNKNMDLLFTNTYTVEYWLTVDNTNYNYVFEVSAGNSLEALQKAMKTAPEGARKFKIIKYGS